MRFVNENARAMRLGDAGQISQFPEIAIHRIDSLYNDKLSASALVTQSGVERCRVVVFKLLGPTTRKHSAIAQAQVRSIIEDGNVALAEQTGNSAECSAKSAVEEHCVFATEKFCDSRFQFAMKIGHA